VLKPAAYKLIRLASLLAMGLMILLVIGAAVAYFRFDFDEQYLNSTKPPDHKVRDAVSRPK